MHKIWPVICGYGLVRNSIVATMIPMKKDELYTKRIGSILMASAGTPFFLPTLIGNDFSNIERKFRGMKIEYFVPFV